MIRPCFDALTINEDNHGTNQEQHAELHLVRFFSLAGKDIHATVCSAYIHAALPCFSDSNHVLLIFVGNLRKKYVHLGFTLHYSRVQQKAVMRWYVTGQTKGPAEVKRHSRGRWPQK